MACCPGSFCSCGLTAGCPMCMDSARTTSYRLILISKEIAEELERLKWREQIEQGQAVGEGAL